MQPFKSVEATTVPYIKTHSTGPAYLCFCSFDAAIKGLMVGCSLARSYLGLVLSNLMVAMSRVESTDTF
jgi:hypothetical protein